MTQHFTAILLRHFKGPLHLSFGKEDNYDRTQTSLHSDTLKSAIAVCAMQLGLSGGDEELKNFMSSFSISSAFPMLSLNDEVKFFFPKPTIAERLSVKEEAKKAKKVQYVEKNLFEHLLSSKVEVLPDTVKGSFAFANTIKDSKVKVFESQADQHIAIPRDMDSDSNPYYVDKLYFAEKGGLFFLTDAMGETLNKIIACIKLLADNGIGTDRTTGKGQFEFDETKDVQTISLTLPDSATYEIALSLYCPEKEEMQDLEKSYYDLVKRGGFIASPENDNHLSIRKKSVYMFTEGSVFPVRAERKGKIVDLKPDNVALKEAGQSEVTHSIWRDGTCIFLPIIL